jgi:hypothetical protein
VTAPTPRRRLGTSVHVARPMFQVLRDDSQTCVCHAYGGQVCNSSAMTVTAAEYDRPDRWFL